MHKKISNFHDRWRKRELTMQKDQHSFDGACQLNEMIQKKKKKVYLVKKGARACQGQSLHYTVWAKK